MADTNWIKLNRKIWDNFIWDFENPRYALAWIDMLLMANYADKKILFDGKPLTVQRGSFVASMVKLAERWHMNRKTVKSFLDTLQADGMITYVCTKRCTTVYILNYLAYQGFAGFDDVPNGQLIGQQNGQQWDNSLDNCGTTERTQHKKVKKIEEDSKNIKENTLTDLPADNPPGASARVDYEAVKSMYNEICVSLSRCTSLSDARKKAIKARFASGHNLEDFKALFTKAEASSFLKGKNDRNWTASFDWLIKDANMAKVLDGNYDDRKRNGGSQGYDDNDLDFIPN